MKGTNRTSACLGEFVLIAWFVYKYDSKIKGRTLDMNWDWFKTLESNKELSLMHLIEFGVY